jgi:hypothetical protein
MWNASQFLDLYLGELKGNGVQSYRRVFPASKITCASVSTLFRVSGLRRIGQKLGSVQTGTNLEIYIYLLVFCASSVKIHAFSTNYMIRN